MRWIALALALAGCGDGGTGTLALSWRFADGRGCPESGAFTVRVKWGDESIEPRCTEGVAPAAFAVEKLPRGGVELALEAITPHGGVVYRGEASLDPLPPSWTVTLHPTP